ncbi:hypothetical protein [Brevibacillus massiliensis]|uniref:hypothetical protein n=1 Tax=Brevibacillus massiliensis TaxID=1118054 RepID=UPI00031B6519|nr:hypothetical protein [Brevibacillus massiliensis]
MNMKVTNRKLAAKNIEIDEVIRSSLVLLGDAEVITCSSVFDTPADSLIFSRAIPFVPPNRAGHQSGFADRLKR